ncbi:hypothetical protein IIA15_11205, partial [candidate division TA06 bacterium]|nr:hypothetical protein [candidate division TA06 bacterium]
MNKIGVSVLFLTLFYGFFEDRADAQWTSYLNSHTVNQIAAQDSFIWCATTGAVARFHKLDTTFTKFTNVDGLADNKVQALSIDSSGNLWFVHEDSEVSVFDGVNQWNYFVDLDGIPGNGLSIATQGNRVWVGTDDGVWQLDTGGNPFDSDLAGCPFLNDTVIQAIVVKDTLLWFGTPNGICETSTDSLDICQILYTTADGLPSNVIQVIIIVGDTLWTGTINGIARKAIIDSIWIPLTNSGLPSTNVRSLAWGNDTLWAGTANGIARWNGTGWEILNVGLLNKSISSILIDSVGVPWVGTLGKGIAKFEDSSSTWTPHFSKDIAHNWVVEVAVDLDGSVWCAHYPKSRQVSHLRLDGEWEIFDAESLWGVTTGFPRSIAVDSYGNKWVGVWGGYDGGTQIVKIESDTFKTFRLPTNSEAVGKVEVDSQNNKWFSGLGIVTSDFIARLASDDSTWIVYRKGVKTEKIFSAIAIDSTDKKWFGSASSGLHRFDDAGTPEIKSDDIWVSFSTGLPSTIVLDVEVDRWNKVWVATKGGAAVIQDGIITQILA